MPKLVEDQGDRGSFGNPIPLTLLISGLGMGRTIMRGSVNSGDTRVITGFDGYASDDS